jgi:hypothetical protein
VTVTVGLVVGSVVIDRVPEPDRVATERVGAVRGESVGVARITRVTEVRVAQANHE